MNYGDILYLQSTISEDRLIRACVRFKNKCSDATHKLMVVNFDMQDETKYNKRNE